MGKAVALQLTPAPVCGEKLPVFRHLGCDLGRVSWTAATVPAGAGCVEACMPCLVRVPSPVTISCPCAL